MTGAKRVFDLVAALLGLAVSAPLWPIIAAAIKLSSRGTVLHRAVRVGRYGEPFTLLKFRTMRVGSGTAVTAAHDTRITTVGRWLRMTKLDELPQLLNVILGHMSIVGPRPEDPRFVAHYTVAQREVLSARPGLISPAVLAHLDEEAMLANAVAGGADVEATYIREILPVKLRMDLEYVTNWRLRDDIAVCARIVGPLFRRAIPRSDRGIDETQRVAATYADYRQTREPRWAEGSPANASIIAERDRHFAEALASLDATASVLEVGCGSGGVLAALRTLLPNSSVIGCDLLAERLDTTVCVPVVVADARQLPFRADGIDVVVVSVMMSSVSRRYWRTVADELVRVAKPGGSILWYDMRIPNPANRNVRPLTRRTLRYLFPNAIIHAESTTLIPQVARAMGRYSTRWYGRLVHLPLLRSHLIGTITLPTS